MANTLLNCVVPQKMFSFVKNIDILKICGVLFDLIHGIQCHTTTLVSNATSGNAQCPGAAGLSAMGTAATDQTI